jgi:hypothetical protein
MEFKIIVFKENIHLICLEHSKIVFYYSDKSVLSIKEQIIRDQGVDFLSKYKIDIYIPKELIKTEQEVVFAKSLEKNTTFKEYIQDNYLRFEKNNDFESVLLKHFITRNNVQWFFDKKIYPSEGYYLKKYFIQTYIVNKIQQISTEVKVKNIFFMEDRKNRFYFCKNSQIEIIGNKGKIDILEDGTIDVDDVNVNLGEELILRGSIQEDKLSPYHTKTVESIKLTTNAEIYLEYVPNFNDIIIDQFIYNLNEKTKNVVSEVSSQNMLISRFNIKSYPQPEKKHFFSFMKDWF